jgi:hypothetical protein
LLRSFLIVVKEIIGVAVDNHWLRLRLGLLSNLLFWEILVKVREFLNWLWIKLNLFLFLRLYIEE